MVEFVHMPGPFGAFVDGLDLSQDPGSETMQELVDRLYRHRILLLRDQHPDPAEYARFGRKWGDPIEFFVPGARDRTYPELIRISNSPRTPEVARDGAMHWHADSSYEAVPAAVTMLLAEEAPLVGNETLFADCTAAYEALAPDIKDRIGDLQVVHDPNGGKVALDEEVRGGGHHYELPVVTHPLVMAHPGTWVMTLYGFSGTAAGIVGMGEHEGVDLLMEIKRHVLQPRFRQHAQAEAGTILMWDNYAVIHSATPTEYSDEDGKRRLLYRISTRGLPAVLRSDEPSS
jgi:alpha-ketoglutarate-dependent taurine dioxygenase